MYGYISSYFFLLIAFILKYEEELINCPDRGRKVNSNFNECNLSRICNNLQRWWSHFFLHLTPSPSANGPQCWLQLINYLLEGLSLAHLLFRRPTEEYGDISKCKRRSIKCLKDWWRILDKSFCSSTGKSRQTVFSWTWKCHPAWQTMR